MIGDGAHDVKSAVDYLTAAAQVSDATVCRCQLLSLLLIINCFDSLLCIIV